MIGRSGLGGNEIRGADVLAPLHFFVIMRYSLGTPLAPPADRLLLRSASSYVHYDILLNMKVKHKTLPSLAVEFDREEDGRWIAEIPKLSGVMAYGVTKHDALRHVYAVGLRTLADKVEQGKMSTRISRLFSYEMASR